jgi:hypothetical protein
LSYESDKAFILRAFLNAASTAWLAAKKTPQKTLRRKKVNQISFCALERKPRPTKEKIYFKFSGQKRAVFLQPL